MGKWFKAVVTLLIGGVTSLSSWAGALQTQYVPADLKGVERKLCMQMLEEAVESHLAPGLVRMSIGNLRGFRAVLRKSGASSEAVTEIDDWLQGQLSSSADHPVWAHTLQEVRNQISDPGLFVCVLKPNSAFAKRNGSLPEAMYAGMYGYREVSFPQTNPPMVPVSERRRPECVGGNCVHACLHAVVLKMPGSYERRHFLSDLAHELTHAADTELFSQWILANYSLIETGRFEEVDTLFVELTRELDDGTVLIDEGFYGAFSESRGYSVSDWFERSYPDSGAAEPGVTRWSLPPNETAIEVIKRLNGGWFLERYNIDSTNIFDFGNELGKRFEKVIQAAGLKLP